MCIRDSIDAEVGRLLDTLDELKLTENTYVIYTTDNGPWLQFKHHGGSAGPLRDGKGTTFEGGQRVPCLIRGPGIPAGSVCDELTGTIDVLPTIAALTGKPLPKQNKIDGIDVSKLWLGKIDQSPRSEFIHYTSQGNLEGLRQGDWKLLVKRPRQRRNQKNATASKAKPQIMLFDLSKDIAEQNNLAAQQPEIVARLQQRMKQLDDEITMNARNPWLKDDK